MFTLRYDKVLGKDVTGKMVRNPNYGGKPCSVPGTCIAPFKQRAQKVGLHAALMRNVLRDGFRNPIILYSTPEGLLLGFGGSRLRVSVETGILTPAIIVDYTGDYADCEEVTKENWKQYFKDVPVYYEFSDIGFDYHYSLERARRETYDEAGFAWVDDEDNDFLDLEFPWL